MRRCITLFVSIVLIKTGGYVHCAQHTRPLSEILHNAINLYRDEEVSHLLDVGANPYAQSTLGHNSLDLAQKKYTQAIDYFTNMYLHNNDKSSTCSIYFLPPPSTRTYVQKLILRAGRTIKRIRETMKQYDYVQGGNLALTIALLRDWKTKVEGDDLYDNTCPLTFASIPLTMAIAAGVDVPDKWRGLVGDDLHQLGDMNDPAYAGKTPHEFRTRD